MRTTWMGLWIALGAALGAAAAQTPPRVAFTGDFRVGGTVNLTFTAAPGDGYIVALGSQLRVEPVATPYGASKLANVLYHDAGVLTTGTLRTPFGVPADGRLVGLRFFAQGLAYDPVLKQGALSRIDEVVLGPRVPDLAEKTAARWTAGAQDYTATHAITDDTAVKQVGAASIRWQTTAAFLATLVFPETRNAGWDLTGNRRLEFWVRAENKNPSRFQGNWPVVRLGNQAGGAFAFRPWTNLLNQAIGRWVKLTVPLAGGAGWSRDSSGAVSLDAIDFLEVRADTWGAGFTLWLDGIAFGPKGVVRPFAPTLLRPDLDVTYVERLPRTRRYDVIYPGGIPTLRPGTEKEKRWPDVNESVSFRAHLRNAGRQASGAILYDWWVDEKKLASGRLPGLKPGQATTTSLPWRWQAGRHAVRFAVRTADGTREISTVNNEAAFPTDALTFGFWMERTTREQLDRTANLHGSFSAEDWLNVQLLDFMTGLFTASTYPGIGPAGIVQRVRIDKFTVVPDNTLPAGGTHAPVDREVDGVWGYAARGTREYVNHAALMDTALLHELSHQLGLIDLYRLDLPAASNKVNGQPFRQPHAGLMGGGDIRPHTGVHYSSHSVFGLNVTLAKRRGYYGEYLFAVPDACALAITDASSRPVAGAAVRIYQTALGLLDATPEITGTTSTQGIFSLPNRPTPTVTTATGLTLKPNPFGRIDVVGRNGLWLVEVKKGGKTGYAFVPITAFNLAWARGSRSRYTHPVQVTMR